MRLLQSPEINLPTNHKRRIQKNVFGKMILPLSFVWVKSDQVFPLVELLGEGVVQLASSSNQDPILANSETYPSHKGKNGRGVGDIGNRATNKVIHLIGGTGMANGPMGKGGTISKAVEAGGRVGTKVKRVRPTAKGNNSHIQ